MPSRKKQNLDLCSTSIFIAIQLKLERGKQYPILIVLNKPVLPIIRIECMTELRSRFILNSEKTTLTKSMSLRFYSQLSVSIEPLEVNKYLNLIEVLRWPFYCFSLTKFAIQTLFLNISKVRKVLLLYMPKDCMIAGKTLKHLTVQYCIFQIGPTISIATKL